MSSTYIIHFKKDVYQKVYILYDIQKYTWALETRDNIGCVSAQGPWYQKIYIYKIF